MSLIENKDRDSVLMSPTSPTQPRTQSFRPDISSDDLVIGRMEHICPVLNTVIPTVAPVVVPKTPSYFELERVPTDKEEVPEIRMDKKLSKS